MTQVERPSLCVQGIQTALASLQQSAALTGADPLMQLRERNVQKHDPAERAQVLHGGQAIDHGATGCDHAGLLRLQSQTHRFFQFGERIRTGLVDIGLQGVA
jgi:hypothetical protein